MPATGTQHFKEATALYRYYVVVMLTLVYVFNFIDRQLLVILQESIKKELNLTDTQLGLLSGFTFALFYVTMGIPIARLADKGNRRNIVALSLAVWSLMTAFSGLSKNFLHLALARIGVGVGEAGGSPPAHAMISDYFPPAKRATALAFYSSGLFVGILVGYLMGGYLNQELGWRMAFLVLGTPGVAFSLLFYVTVKEPQRGATDAISSLEKNGSFTRILKLLYTKKTFVYLAIGSGCQVFSNFGVGNWMPSFLARLHGLSVAEIGIALGLIVGCGGALGVFSAGLLTDRLGKKDKRWYLKIPAFANLFTIPFGLVVLFSHDLSLVFCSLTIYSLLYSMFLGPSIAVSHALVPASLRSLTSAVLFFVMNLIGMGFGPIVVGMISDWLLPSLGNESLRWAMTFGLVGMALSTFFYIKAAKNLPLDLV